MTYYEFLNEIRREIRNRMGNNAEVTIIQVPKNNGVVLDGLIIREQERNITPTIYLNSFFEQYQRGKKKTDILNEILQLYAKCAKDKDLDIGEICDFGNVKGGIFYRVINYERNREQLENVPYVRFLDLAIVFYCRVPSLEKNEKENACFQIREEHLKMWEADIGDVYREAIHHTPELYPPEISCMSELLEKMRKQQLKEYGESRISPEELKLGQEVSQKLYVLTNSAQLYGASCMLYHKVLFDFAKNLNCDFYLLPSSVHEVLLLPKKGETQVAELEHMVQEVNHCELDPEEILSDHVYCYCRETDEIMRAEE